MAEPTGKRITIQELARLAKVSTATVDRVLNNRGSVHERTRTHVMRAATETGYIGDHIPMPAKRRTLDFILPGRNMGFIKSLADGFREAGEAYQQLATVRIHTLSSNDPTGIVAQIEDIRHSTNGVGVIAFDHAQVREALLSLVAEKVPVLTLVSDMTGVPHNGYIGCDNRMSGRLAGSLIGRFLSKDEHKVLLLTNAYEYRGHEEREMGFRHVISEEFANISLISSTRVVDDSAITEATEVLNELIKTDPISGVYCVGRGAPAVAKALERLGIARDIVFVAHELNQFTRPWLVSGVIDALIDQNCLEVARKAIARLIDIDQRTSRPSADTIDVNIIMRDNIPSV
jgi:LacI family transcriptional regulator